MDSTAVNALHQMVLDLRNQNIELYIAGAIGPVRDILHSSGLTELVGKDHFFVRTVEAFECFQNKAQHTDIQRKISQETQRRSSVT